jgi:transcription elongation factor Elf1
MAGFWETLEEFPEPSISFAEVALGLVCWQSAPKEIYFIDESPEGLEGLSKSFGLSEARIPIPESLRPRKRKENEANRGTCTHCGVVASSQWRKGPQGYRTVCNACGLRWARCVRKLRKVGPIQKTTSFQSVVCSKPPK